MIMDDSTKSNSKILLFAFLLFLISGPELATDMYVPSLPAIANYLHITKSSAALTITAYLLGMGIFQFFYGAFSDHHGRKKTLLISTVVCLAGNIIAMTADSFTQLMIGRLIQGAGAGASVSMTLAIARDAYEGPQLAKTFSILFAFYFGVFGCAPIIGGYLQHYLSWRYNFIVLAAYFGIQLIWLLLLFHETYTPPQNASQNTLKTSLCNYWMLIKSRAFMGNMLASTFIYSALFAYAALTPFLFQKELGLSAVDYGWLGVFIAAGLIVGNILGAKLVAKLGMNKPNIPACILLALGSIIMFILSFFNLLGIWVVMVPFAIYTMGLGITGVTCPANAMTPFGNIAGAAGALWGGLQFIILFILSFVYAHVSAKTQLPFASILIGLVVICAAFLYWVKPRKN
jgi:Bcr/CflA subfamily drug resistance transporter